jgi:hypothetical protein
MKVIAVIGMWRSGTTCLANELAKLGVDFGDVPESTYEDRRIVHIHARGCSWYRPRKFTIKDEDVEGILAEWRHRQDSGRRLGVKEPAMLFGLESWRNFAELEFVGTFRHPAAVFGNLRSTFGIHHSQFDRAWCRYHARFLELHSEKPFPIVCFDWAEDEYRRALDVACRAIGVDGASSPDFTRRLERKLTYSCSNESADIYSDLIKRASSSVGS